MKDYDLVIQNGTIIDGKRTPRFKGDIGIRDGKIETIGKVHTDNAKEVINETIIFDSLFIIVPFFS